MNAKAEQKERTHETILVSAVRLLREKGIAGARVADVMRGAKLTVGGFYAHFTSKEALVDTALRLASAQMRERLFAGLDDKPAQDRAQVILKRYLSAAHRDEFVRGCPFPAVIGEVGTTAPEHGPVVAEQVEAMAEALETHLASGAGGGGSGAGAPGGAAMRGVPRRYIALGLVALMYGGLSLSRALRGTELSDDVLKACRAVGILATNP